MQHLLSGSLDTYTSSCSMEQLGRDVEHDLESNVCKWHYLNCLCVPEASFISHNSTQYWTQEATYLRCSLQCKPKALSNDTEWHHRRLVSTHCKPLPLSAENTLLDGQQVACASAMPLGPGVLVRAVTHTCS